MNFDVPIHGHSVRALTRSLLIRPLIYIYSTIVAQCTAMKRASPRDSDEEATSSKRPRADDCAHTSFGKFSFTFDWSIDGLYAVHPVSTKQIESPLFTFSDLQWKLIINQPSNQLTMSLVLVGPSPTTSECVKLEGKPNQMSVVYSVSTVYGKKPAVIMTSKPQLMKSGSSSNLSFIRQSEIETFSASGEFAMRCNIDVWHINKPFHFHSDCTTCTVRPPNDQVAELMKIIYQKAHHTDVTVVAEGEEFKAHKCMLSASSDVFERMLQQPMAETANNIIKIEDITAKILKVMFEFIYTGHVKEIDRDKATELLAVAEKYNMQAMKMLCSTELHRSLDTSNVVDTLYLARLYRSKELKETCMKFIVNHKEAIQHTAPDDWRRLNEDYDVFLY